MGASRDGASHQLWSALRQEVVVGRFVNFVCEHDAFYEMEGLVDAARSERIGAKGLFDIPGIDNVDVSNLIAEHRDWNSKGMLKLVFRAGGY